MRDRIQSAFACVRADAGLVNSTAACLHREMEKRKQREQRFTRPGLKIVFAAIAAMTVGIFAHGLYFTADAHVSIDVNPSVELTINRFDRVIGAYAFNEDGVRILSGADLRWKTYNEAAGLVLSRIESGGYLTQDAIVSVTVQAANSDKEQVLCDTLRQFVAERTMPAYATAEVFPVTSEDWSDAHGCNMSPARYLAIRELMEVDGEATLEAYSDSGISQIRQRTRECHDAHNIESNGGNSEQYPLSGHGHMQDGEHGHSGGR